jgi:TfoX/Sxy family transcriptional regulator of competence genes
MPISRDAKLAAFEELVAATADLERKGKTMPYTSMNGNMFSFLSKDGELAFRLARADRDAFLERFPDAVVEQYGAVMKDYVEVPDAILEDGDELQRLFALSVEQARALKPKATTRPKKKA